MSGAALPSAGNVIGLPSDVSSAERPTRSTPPSHSTPSGSTLEATETSHSAKATRSSSRPSAISAATTCWVGWRPAETPGPKRSTTTERISVKSSLR